MKNKVKLFVALLFVPGIAEAEEPRWGIIQYDLNMVEYAMPKCEQSKVKRLSLRRENKRIVIRLECEPVPGEVNLPNPDLLEVR